MYLVLSVMSDAFVHEREEEEDMSLSGKLGPMGAKDRGKKKRNMGSTEMIYDLYFLISNNTKILDYQIP